MASPTRWIWVWVNSGSWWWRGRPGMLRFMGSQRVGHNWVTELNWTTYMWYNNLIYTRFLHTKFLKAIILNFFFLLIFTHNISVLNSTWLILFLLFSCPVVSDYLWPHKLQHTRLPCTSPVPAACSNPCSLSQWCHPTIASSVIPFFSCLQSFPTSGCFPLSCSSHQVAKILELQHQQQSL